MQTILKAVAPLALGLLAFVLFMHASQSDGGFSTKNWAMVPTTAFEGVNFVYAMFYASLTTVIVGTSIYLYELGDVKDLASGTPGRKYIKGARLFLLLSVIGVPVVIFMPLLARHGVADSDGCLLQALYQQSHRHDWVVICTFLAFLAADALTMRGMKLAHKGRIEDYSRSERECKVSGVRDFAKMQLLLVDVPVLAGAFVSGLIIANASSLSHWNSELLYVVPNIHDVMEKARSTSLVICSNQALSLEEFADSTARVFVAGIAMGYLAAHILMSQLVFIILNVVHARRQREIEATST